MIINQTRMEAQNNTFGTSESNTSTQRGALFRYIVKEKSKNVIVISSDEEESDNEVLNSRSSMPIQHLEAINGHAADPISLDDSDEEMELDRIPDLATDIALAQLPDSMGSIPSITHSHYQLSTDAGRKDEVKLESKMKNSDQIKIADLLKLYESHQDVILAHLNESAERQVLGNINGSSSTQIIFEKKEELEEDYHLSTQIKKTETVMNNNDTSKELISRKRSRSILSEAAEAMTRIETSMMSVDRDHSDSEGGEESSALSNYVNILSDIESIVSEMTSPPVIGFEDLMEVDVTGVEENNQLPTTVNTITPTDTSTLELLRMIEMYGQSLSEPTRQTENITSTSEIRSSRRTKRFQDSANSPNYYRNSKTNDASNSAPRAEPNNPYVPSQVWYNSTWEDWAQLDEGDILHCPFSTEEIAIVKNCVEKHFAKKNKISRELVNFWQYVSTLLPGRTPLECQCFWIDYTDHSYTLYKAPIMVRRRKSKPSNNSRQQLISKRARLGLSCRSFIQKLHWSNMTREDIISGGSGDAISLAIFNDSQRGLRIAIGSLCDENIQYNMPGNMRLWDSETRKCLSLKGHQTKIEETGQDIWRTVTDIKMSKDKSLIYSASHDGSTNVWLAKSGKLVSTLQFHCKPVNQLAVNYSKEDNMLASCSNDGTATIWEIGRNGKTGSGHICELDTMFYSDPRVDCIEFGNNATQDLLFLGINNKNIHHPGYIEVFDTVRIESVMKYDSMMGCVSTLAVSQSGKYIVSGNYNRYDNMSGDGFIHLHESRQQKVVSKFYSGHPDVNIVTISPCERYVASGNADKEKSEVVIFDVRNNKKILHKLNHDQTLVSQSLIAADSSIGIGGLYWSADSRTVITGGGDSTVKIWSVEGETRLIKSYQTTNCVTSLTVDEDTMTIAAGSAGAQGIVHVWRP